MYKEYKEKCESSENTLLIPRINDKIEFTKKKNKITYTNFLNGNEKTELIKYLKSIKFNNYILFGGNENSERLCCIFYPDKLNENIVMKKIDDIFCTVRIKVSKEDNFEHGDYLKSIIKLGIERCKIGDIVVNSQGADIVIFKENSEYIFNNLKLLTRFRKSNIELISIYELYNKPVEYEYFSIIVSSIRLDCFVSEIAHCSRTKANEYIELGKVLVNYVKELNFSKKLQPEDIITIRGKGKFIFENIEKMTSKNRFVINIKKYK